MIELFPRGWFKKIVMQSDKANLEEKEYTAVTSSTLLLQLRMEKGELEKNAGERESGTFEFYPKGTQVRQRGDVSDKINGQKIQRERESATETTCWNPPLRGLAKYAIRSLSRHAGTRRSRSGIIKRRRTVNLD